MANKIKRVFAVVAASAAVGWLLGAAGLSMIAQQASPQAAVTTEAEHREPPAGKAHAWIDFDRNNYGAPGVLEVHAAFHVGAPDIHVPGLPDAREADVVLIIADPDDLTPLMPPITIGHVTDTVGVGDWEKDVQWVIPLDPGDYAVTIAAGPPGATRAKADGTIEPYYWVRSRERLTVN